MSWLKLNDDFEPIREDWFDLEQRLSAPLEYAPEWIRASALSAGLLEDVFVCIEHGGETPASYSPLVRTNLRKFGLACGGWEMPGLRLVSNHSELVSEGSRSEYLARLVDTLPKPADILVVPAVVEGSATEEAIVEFSRRSAWRLDTIPGNESPYIALDTTWEDFLSRRSGNLRSSLKRKQNALSKKGNVSQKWFHDRDDVGELFDHVLAIEEHSWKVAAGMAISRRENEQSYYRLLLPFLADIGALVANILYVDEEPVAYSLCYASRGRLAQLKTSFVEEFQHASPGLIANQHSIRHAFDSGFQEFDFLGDIMPHKMQWTEKTRRHSDYFLFGPRLKPRVLQLIKSMLAGLRGGRKRLPTLGRGGRQRTP